MPEGVPFFLAFTAGLLSFFSPCFLPLVPVYLTYLSGTSGNRVSLGKTLAFISGFSLIFILLGASASYFGQILLEHQEILRKVSGVVIVLLGLHLLGILPISFLYREKRWFGEVKKEGWIGTFLLGVAFSFGWTPCIGPVLSSILLMASTAKTLGAGIGLLFIYSLGLGVPFFLTAFFWQYFAGRLLGINKYLPLLEKVSGILLVILGIMVFANWFSRLNGLIPYINF